MNNHVNKTNKIKKFGVIFMLFLLVLMVSMKIKLDKQENISMMLLQAKFMNFRSV